MGKQAVNKEAFLAIIKIISEYFEDQDIATQFMELAQKGLVNIDEEQA
jgi:hypothetical protein